MSNHRALLIVMLSGCLGLFGCSSQSTQQTDQSQPGQSTGTTAAGSADQAGWQMYTKQAEAALSTNDKAGAEKNYKLAIAEAMKLGADTPAVAASTANLADFYYVQGDGDKADDLYKRSLAMYEKAVGTQHVDLIKDLTGLGKVSVLKKKYADAVTYYQRAAAISKQSGLPVSGEITAGLDLAKKMASGKQPPSAKPPTRK